MKWLVATLLFVLAGFALGQDNPVEAQPDDEPAIQEAEAADSQAVPEQADNEPDISARGRYNLALARLEDNELETAVEAFLRARDEAGPDGELRYRSAFNLGIALAGLADNQQAENPEEAIETLRNAGAWFNDAIRLAPENDNDARVNLEVVLRRIQQLADQLNQGNRLEARLDRIIDDQRGLRDRIRQLLAAIEAEGAGAEPVGFQRQFEELATFERVLLAEAGSIGDLAAEERALIEEKPEDQRTQQEAVRVMQLQGLDYYLQQGRQSLSDARRRLRRLEAERSHDRADAGLAELKRAREQLMDPITVLKSVVQDESSILMHTQALDLFEQGGIRVNEEAEASSPPVWLTSDHLHIRQAMVTSRASEVLARLEAGASAAVNEEMQADPQQRRMLKAAREALPFLETGVAAMKTAESQLFGNDLPNAVESEGEAVKALLSAIEQFADVRQLIDITYADQERLLALLDPSEAAELADLPTEERAQAVDSIVLDNLTRLERLESMLQEEQAAMEAQLQAQADPAQGAAPDAAGIQEKYTQAETLRSQAMQSLRKLETALNNGGADLIPPAQESFTNIEALRRLFFNLVEHLRELLKEQTDTYDRTATLGFEAVLDKLIPELGLAAERQTQHTAMAGALTQALAQQADEAGAGGDPQQAEMAEKMAEAAQEVRQATGRMSSAEAMLGDAVAMANSMSPDLEPALEDQLAAIEHLETALQLLQPPQQSDQGDQQQQQQQQQQQSEQEEMSQRQALRRLQAIRDREAERQRQREQQPAQTQPVEKDW